MSGVFFVLVLLVQTLYGSSRVPFSLPDNYKIKTIVIDAGHGGKDPGAVGIGKTYEKDITLAVSLKLGELIKQHYPYVKVVYTRTKDEFVELHDRAAIANRHGADLFVSVHCNSSADKNVTGLEVYCLGLHRTEANLEVAKRENSVILLEDNYVEKYDGFDPNAAEAHIIFSLFQYAYLNQSISFASKIDHHYPLTTGRRSRGVKQAGFLVLYKTTMPGVLVELGFLSNREEELFMKSADGQEKMAMALFRAFEHYLNNGNASALPKNDESDKKNQMLVEQAKSETSSQPARQLQTTGTIPPVTSSEKNSATVTVNTSGESGRPGPQELPEIPSSEKITSDNPEFIFKVQFFATKTRLPENDERLKLVHDWEIEKTETGIYRYLSGRFFSLRAAEEQMKILRQIGYTDAFIAPYLNGTKRITMKEYLDKYQK